MLGVAVVQVADERQLISLHLPAPHHIAAITTFCHWPLITAPTTAVLCPSEPPVVDAGTGLLGETEEPMNGLMAPPPPQLKKDPPGLFVYFLCVNC